MPCIDDGCNGKYFGCWMFFRCQYPIIWHRFSCELTSDCVAHLNAFNPIFEPIFDDSRSLAGSNDILLTHPVFLGTTLSVDGAIFCSSAFTVLLCILHNTFSHMKTSGTVKIKCLAALAATLLFVIFQVYLSCNSFFSTFDGIPNSSPWNANLFNNLSQNIFWICWWMMMARFSLLKKFIVALLYYL